MSPLRVMAYNIEEGERLPAAAEVIRTLNPDIVLLNEVLNPLFGVDQVDFIVERCGFPYHQYESTTTLFNLSGDPVGTKGVAILSRYPLLETRMHPVLSDRWWLGSTEGTLQATMVIGNLVHDVFSTRFSPMHEEGIEVSKNEAGHLQALDLVRSVPSHRAVIFGGDFNAQWYDVNVPWRNATWSLEFRDKSGLTDAIAQYTDEFKLPPPGPRHELATPCRDYDPDDDFKPGDLSRRVDYIYYRGPYRVSRASMTCGSAQPTDHPYVYVELERNDTRVPDVRRQTRAQAEEVIRGARLMPRFTGSNDPNALVASQDPDAGSRATVGSTVTLRLTADPASVVVPNVRGKEYLDAAAEIEAVGLQVQVSGTVSGDAVVVSQSPEGGNLVPAGSTVRLRLRQRS